MFSVFALDPTHVAQCLSESKDSIIPERKLLTAVLIRGIADALSAKGLGKVHPDIMREAWAWIAIIPFQHDPKPFSFQWLCEALELCPKAIRKHVIRAKQLAHKMHLPGGRSVKIYIS